MLEIGDKNTKYTFNIHLSGNSMLAYIMENQVSPEIISPSPKETFERVLTHVRKQTAIRNEIMRVARESAIKLQEERGPIMLYGL